MSAPAFTPGPWQAHKEHIGVDGKGTVAAVQNPWNNEAERLANARLIAAAPELYEALEALMRAFRMIYEVNGDDPTHTTVFPEAQAALAKARGDA